MLDDLLTRVKATLKPEELEQLIVLLLKAAKALQRKDETKPTRIPIR